MKKLCFLYNKIFVIILVLTFLIFENICFGAELESIATLEKQVIQIEELWQAGNTNEYFIKAREIAKKINPSMNITYTEEQYKEANNLLKAGKTNEYYAKIEEFSKEFLSHSITGNLNTIASKLFDNIMSKKANVIDTGNNDLYALEDLMKYLAVNDKISIEERRINALLLCRYLGKIRKEQIPDFKPKPTVMNVSPPRDIPHSGPRVGIGAGITPNAITNPVAKAQYLSAIRENRENGLINSRQRNLKSMGDEVTSTHIMDYIIKTFRGDDVSIALFNECIKAADLTDKEKEEVFKKVGIKQLKQGKISGAAVQGQQNTK